MLQVRKLNLQKFINPKLFSMLSVSLLFFFSVLSFAKMLFASNRILVGNEVAIDVLDPVYAKMHNFESCGWDGVRYCAQFFGGTRVDSPFSRRQIAALAARLLDSDPIKGFLKLNLFSLSFAVLLGLLIVQPDLLRFLRRKQKQINQTDGHLTLISTLAVISVFLTARNTFHIMFSAPVLTDPLGLMLTLASIFCVLNAKRVPIFILGCVLSFLSPLVREQSGVTIFVCTGTLLFFGCLKFRQFVLFNGFVIGGTLLAINIPSSGKPVLSLWQTLNWHFNNNFESFESVMRFGVMLMLSLGCFPFFLARKSVRQALSRTDTSILVSAICLFLVSVFGGGDTDRILMPVGILFVLVAARMVIRSEEFLSSFVFCVIQFVVSQSSTTITSSDHLSFLRYFGLRYLEFSGVITNGLKPIMEGLYMACLYSLIAFVLKSKKSSSDFESKLGIHHSDRT